MHVEDYMNETPARLLAMLTQTREDLGKRRKRWRIADLESS